MITGLGEAGVLFNIEGIRQHLAQRPMSRDYARGQLEALLKFNEDLTDDLVWQITQVGFEVAGDSDPVSDQTANDVQNVVLAALGQSNQVAQQLASDTQQAKQTYEFWRDLPAGIGDWLGRAAAVPVQIATHGIWETLKAFLSDPVSLVVIGGAAAIYYHSKHAPRTNPIDGGRAPEIESITYVERKPGDKKAHPYKHDFEGRRPRLAWNGRDLKIARAGSRYRVRQGWIHG